MVGSYPVAEKPKGRSGSNKFCLAVLAWENGTSRRAIGWAGEKGARSRGLVGPRLYGTRNE
jgi:hypothetical protein